MARSYNSEAALFRLRVFAAAILALVVAVSAVYLSVQGGLPRFETNILATLPSVYRNQGVESVARRQAEVLGAKLVVFIRSGSDREAEEVAREVSSKMQASGIFARIDESASLAQLHDVRTFFARAPFQLVDPPRATDDTESVRELFEDALARAFAPEGLEWLRSVTSDPLLLFPEYLKRSVLPSRGRIVARNGSLHIDNAEQATVVIFATVSASALSQHTQQPVLHFFRSLPAYPQATILPTGIALFAEDAAGRMRREISLISTCTMVVLGLLFWWVFRSWRAVLLVMGSVAVSCFGAVVVTALLWESWLGSALHLMTVGFGSSLLGVSSDYAVHYLVTQRSFNTTKGWEPLRKILPGLLLGFITSVVGFLGIACSPFPGLQQLALFSYVGLSLSLLLVITIFPALARGAPYDNRLTRLAAGARQLLSRRARIFLLGVVCVPVVYGLTRVQVVDDIRALDTPSEQVVRNQREGAALLGVGHGGALLIVRGATAEETLQREEQAREILDGLVRAGKIDGYHAVSRNIPSQRRQAERYRRFGVLLRQAPQQLAEFSADLHLPEASQSALHALLQGDTARLLTLAECLESGACDAVRDLVVSESSGAVATVVPLLVPPGTAVQEIFESFEGSAGRTAEGSSLPTPRSDLGSPLSGAGRDGALGVWDLHISGSHLVSQAEAISGALRLYRRSATWGALVFYGVIFLLLALRYGVWGAGRAFVPPLCGGLAALGALGVAGVPLNVFAVFALMVLLGVSVDYAIFFAEDDTEGDSADATGFSVVLSATTTAISFGLLALSSSPALRGFGVVLAVGVVVAALLAPLARRQPQASTAGSGGL